MQAVNNHKMYSIVYKAEVQADGATEARHYKPSTQTLQTHGRNSIARMLGDHL